MEKWQNALIVDVFEINLSKDSKTIKETFSRLCEPLTRYDEIYFYEEDCFLAVSDVIFELTVGVNGINISKRDIGGIIKSVSYLVDENKFYEYKNITIDKVYETDRLESTDFNYEAIINRLMDMLIIQP